MDDKKIWFKALSRTLWIPVSIEGWAAITTFALGLYAIVKFNRVSDDVAFSLGLHWPFLLEFGVIIALFYMITSGHVEK